jgi:hypothetical protein
VADVVGTMTPLNDNVAIAAIRDIASMLATFWVRHVRPMPFERTFYLDGVEVEVRIRESKQNTKPVFGVDEDDRISD